MNFECIGVTGYAGDRTIEAMRECHKFTKAFATYLGVSYRLVGEAQAAKDLPWNAAILESEATFDHVANQLNRVLTEERKPILITPRCAAAIASLPIVIAHHPNVIVLYFDAHGDLNVPASSESQYLGGMPITAVMGEWDSGYGVGLRASNLVHIGGRDFDDAENDFVKQHQIMTLSKAQIEGDLSDFRAVISNRPVFIHLDTDVYDPTEVTAEYTVDNGLFRQHIHKVVGTVVDDAHLIGLEITELSPRTEQQRTQSYTALFESFERLRKRS